MSRTIESWRTAHAFQKCCGKRLVKFEPQSLEITGATPRYENASNKQSQMDFAEILRKTYENGHLVCRQITFKMYL